MLKLIAFVLVKTRLWSCVLYLHIMTYVSDHLKTDLKKIVSFLNNYYLLFVNQYL